VRSGTSPGASELQVMRRRPALLPGGKVLRTAMTVLPRNPARDKRPPQYHKRIGIAWSDAGSKAAAPAGAGSGATPGKQLRRQQHKRLTIAGE